MQEDRSDKECAFCHGRAGYIYRMGDYPVFKCRSCGTGFVAPMPAPDTLKALYDGFHPDLNADIAQRMGRAVASLFPQLGLKPDRDLKMLDVGGGGGFVCKSFEDLHYGQATLVDIDPRSCGFAREALGLRSVLQCDAMSLREHTDERFDFIYCRHLIEHLPDPVKFLETILSCLAPGGMLVAQFPNADSLEYLAYLHLNILYRFRKVRESSGFSSWRTLYTFLTGGILHGIDPPRHLWAISGKGIAAWAGTNDIACDIFARHLGDAAFSPLYMAQAQTSRRLMDFIGQRFLSRIRGGTHLIAVLKHIKR